MRKALSGVTAVALSSAPLGIFLIHRRMSLVGDAMAHAMLPGIAIGYMFAGLSLAAMMIGGLTAGLLVAFLANIVTRLTPLREDTSLASFYLISLALGVTIISIKGTQIDLFHILFGQVLALDDATLTILAVSASFTLVALSFFLRALVIDTVDPQFLKTQDPMSRWTQMMFLGLLVINLLGSFHALGTLLAVALMMLPAITATFWTQHLLKSIAIAMATGLISSWSGLWLSFAFDTPTGPTIVLAAGLIMLLSMVFGRTNGIIWRYVRQHHHTA